MSETNSPKANVNAARLLLEYYGYDSLSYFALNPKKKYFFSSSGRSFLSYTTLAGVALVSGDPIGLAEDVRALYEEFSFFTKGSKLSTCFIGIHEKSLPLLHSFHHKTIHAGDEAIVSLDEYNKNSLKKKVRRAESHISSLGIVCKIYSRKDLPLHYLEQIYAISQEWLQQKGGKEQGFSMTLGRIPDLVDKDCEFILAIKEDTILGYITFVPSYASKSRSLDLSRRRHNTPNGLTEFLLIKAFDYYKEKDIRQVSLNFATFYKHNYQHKYSLFKLLNLIAHKSLSKIYKTNNLYSFNEKFLPKWQSRYVAFEKTRFIPYYLFAIAKTELNI